MWLAAAGTSSNGYSEAVEAKSGKLVRPATPAVPAMVQRKRRRDHRAPPEIKKVTADSGPPDCLYVPPPAAAEQIRAARLLCVPCERKRSPDCSVLRGYRAGAWPPSQAEPQLLRISFPSIAIRPARGTHLQNSGQTS